jgi:micrococcal nuclease
MIASSSWKVGLEYDVVKRDKYGRLLAYVWTQNGKMANAEMLRDGYAVLFTFPPNVKHVEVLRAAQKGARVKKLVIWGEKGLRQMPVDYRREHPRIN